MNSEPKFIIFLRDLRFYSRIGVGEQERAVGNEFRVDVSLKCGASEFRHERLETTISYADVYEEIARCMGRERLLLESVAVEMADDLRERFSKIEGGKISITKQSVPISGIDGRCGVEYEF